MSKNTEVAIAINDIHKEFILPQSKHTSMKQAAVNIVKKNKKVTQKVLDGVSFEINKGDFFGIVGRNGSGKSTLLKLIAGVYYPTNGSIDVNGGLTPFIELGVGFNPELSGHDNVYLNGALLGFTRTQMDEMYDEIVDFAELGPFMDQKLKNYSSGMQVRLAFSIAIKAKNDILIFDEVLAVGDEAFQKKCLGVFEKYKASGQTVVLVTHDMETVRNFCNRALLLNAGEVVTIGHPGEVATKYSNLNQEAVDQDRSKEYAKRKDQHTTLGVKLSKHSDQVATNIKYGQTLDLIVTVDTRAAKNLESIGITLIKQSGEHIGGLNSRLLPSTKWKKTGALKLSLTCDFAPGVYYPYIESFSAPGKRVDDLVGPTFEVLAEKLDWSGLTKIEGHWEEV